MDNFWRSQEWLEYLLNSKHGMVYSDRSFFLNNKFIPLVQEGEEFYSPGFDDDKKILSAIKDLAQEHNIKRIQVDSQIKSYLAINSYTCILDLDDVKPSKGHKAAIARSKKLITSHEYNTESIYRFMEGYFNAAGKKTRPEKAFYILNSWLGKYGFLLIAYCDYKEAGAIYVLHYKDWAYYFMGFTKPEFKDCNITHYLQAKAFDVLRTKGIKYYELGDQPQNSLHYYPTEKEKNIAVFKRGFGGSIVVRPRSEYFFDSEYMKQVYYERINNYLRSEYKND